MGDFLLFRIHINMERPNGNLNANGKKYFYCHFQDFKCLNILTCRPFCIHVSFVKALCFTNAAAHLSIELYKEEWLKTKLTQSSHSKSKRRWYLHYHNLLSCLLNYFMMQFLLIPNSRRIGEHVPNSPSGNVDIWIL